MTALSGVRSSWDMFARNWDLCCWHLQLPALLLELLEQAGVLDGERRLAGERLEQSDDLGRELAGLLAADHQHAEDALLAEQRHGEQRAEASASSASRDAGRARPSA